MSFEGQIDVQKCHVTRGEWYLDDDKAIEISWPAAATTTPPTIVANPFNKLEAKDYDDVTSTAKCIGISLNTITTKPVASVDQRLKPDWINRDLGLVVEGEQKMKNLQSGWTAYPQDEVAPYPHGFVHYLSGMEYLGEVMEVIPYNKIGRVWITKRR